jgi:hypothetical protein
MRSLFRIGFSLVCLTLLIVSMSFAGSKSKKTSSKKQSVKESLYSKLPFNESVDALPAKYMGHDIRAIYNTFEARQEKSKKDDFETTEKYNKRIEAENAKPIIGTLGLSDLFVMSTPAKLEYDADKSIAYATISTSMITKGYSIESGVLSINGPNISSRNSSYLGSNAFGATTEVSSSYSKDSCLAVVNPSVLGINNSDQFFYGVKFTVNNVNVDKAKSLKDNIRVLLIFNITNPFISWGYSGSSATFDSPYSSSREESNVYAKVVGAWVYNYLTGEVILKEQYK